MLNTFGRLLKTQTKEVYVMFYEKHIVYSLGDFLYVSVCNETREVKSFVNLNPNLSPTQSTKLINTDKHKVEIV